MAYSTTTGFVPGTFDDYMFNKFMPRINDRFGTDYTVDTFVGTNWYDILYPVCQTLVESDADFADVWVKLTEYLGQVNARMNNPAVVPDGIVEAFERAGLIASVRTVTSSTAGKIGICIFADTSAQSVKSTIANVIKDNVAGGIWCDGDKTANVTLSNGQILKTAWYEPTNVKIDLRLTVYYVNNNGKSLPSADEITTDLREKIATRYRYGTPFAPDLMYQIATDADYAVKLKLEWTASGASTYSSDIRSTAFNEKLIFDTISVLFSAV